MTEYDMLGRVSRQSVPTEVNGSFEPTGDDLTRGWLWSRQEYDWMGRVVKSIPTDSNGTDGKESLISYEGCGCAGGLVTTVQGPLVPRDDDPQTNARRKQKSYEDILGRAFKAETYEWDGTTVYSTVVNTYNGRDQVTLSRQYAGTALSETYQDTTASYDGHGRTVGQNLPQQDSPGTVFTYNPDGSVLTRTDARGVVTNFAYNNRGLVTSITWNVGSTGVTETAAVEMQYDNLGNRTEMTDGLGTQVYEYDPLSRMMAETRSFTDTLANAPAANNSFRLEYTYHIGGSLKSLKDHYGQQIDYANDRTGRLSSVTGSSFGDVTSYISAMSYRAWGAAKRIEYGNSDSQAITSFDDALRPSAFEVNAVSDPHSKSFDKSYSYYADGLLKLSENGITVHQRFDRLMTYDLAGRTKSVRTGIEAHGETETELINLPFRQDYSYNAFGNLTGRESTLWDYTNGSWDFEYEMVNNRDINAGYDADGRQTVDSSQSENIEFYFDAAGLMWKTARFERYETLIARSGDGGEAKRSQRVWDGEMEEWEDWDHVYFISSTVTGKVVSEATKTGKKRYTYVAAGGGVVARQELTETDTQIVGWQFTDATGLSSRGFSNEELDGLGNNVGILPNLNSSRYENAMTTGESPTFTNPDEGNCEMDGIWVPCSMVYRALNSGAGVQCPNNNCGPRVLWFTKKDGSSMGFLISHFMAFANGWSGNFFPPWFGLGTPQSQADLFNQAAMLARKGISPINLLNPDSRLNFSSSISPTEEMGQFTLWFLDDVDRNAADLAARIKRIVFDPKALSDECAEAFKAVGATPIRDQLVEKNLNFVTESVFMDSYYDKDWAPDKDFAGLMRTEANSRVRKYTPIGPAVTGIIEAADLAYSNNCGVYNGKRYIGLTKWGNNETIEHLSVVIVHALVHSGGLPGVKGGGITDLHYLGEKYDKINEACQSNTARVKKRTSRK
ncbi:MAG: RHS repeat protein [Acidobacteriota bacterium]|nr:MAG: RHS repeat protein [Acidobacteriota bacterium]